MTVNRRLTLYALAVVLAGCQTVRYVPTYCVTKEQLEKLRADKPGKVRGQLTGEADEDLKKITGRLIRVEAWGDGLLTVLGGCASPDRIP